MKGGYFLLNGQFHKESEAVFHLADLSCRAAGFEEVFRAEHNEVLFPGSISNHLLNTANTIGADLTGLIDPEGRLLRKDVSRLLNKNKFYLAAKIEIQIYPSHGHVNVVLRAEEIERGYYPLTEPGLLLSFYSGNYKEIRSRPGYATHDLFIRLAAKRMAEELQKPNLILLNSEGNACESITGSFALLNKQEVVFVGEGAGGYRCAIYEEIIRSAKEAGFHPREEDKISKEDLLNAEELFLFDALFGIQKILGLEDQRYYSTKTQLIATKLTELAKRAREDMRY